MVGKNILLEGLNWVLRRVILKLGHLSWSRSKLTVVNHYGNLGFVTYSGVKVTFSWLISSFNHR